MSATRHITDRQYSIVAIGCSGLLFIGAFALLGNAASYYVLQACIAVFFCLITLRLSLSRGGSIFHPLPLVSIALVWAMGLSPLANIYFDHFVLFPPKVIDFKYWSIYTAIFYCVGVILFYLGARAGSYPVAYRRRRDFILVPDRQKLYKIGFLGLLVSSIAQLFVIWRFSGLSGYMQAWTDERSNFSGLGPLLMIAEALPIIFVMLLFMGPLNSSRVRVTLSTLFAVFILFIMLKILFGGLRGSRSNTIWGIFWFAGMVHLYVKRLRLAHFIFGLIFISIFMVGYSLYKSFGIMAFSGEYSLSDTRRFGELNPVVAILLGDFSRSGIHSYLLHEYFNRVDYSLRWGATYIDSAFRAIPFLRSPFNAGSKGAAAADLFYGQAANGVSFEFHNSRIMGLYGEGVLNFGPIISLAFFFAFGFLLARIDAHCRILNGRDIRVLLIPFVANACLILFLADSDNLVFFVFKNGLMPIIFIYAVALKCRPIAFRFPLSDRPWRQGHVGEANANAKP